MLEKIEEQLGKKGAPWTHAAPLPGGDFEEVAFETELKKLQTTYPFLDVLHARRLFRLYGTRTHMLLGQASALTDLGRHFGADLYEAEVRYLVDNEWAKDAEDILWRRTKLGLRLDAADVTMLEEYLKLAPVA